MNLIDFIIGLTLVNTIPHFVIGIWKGRMLSGLGTSSRANIFYGLFNFSISVSLFLYQYGFEGFRTKGVYAGGFFVVFCYFIVGKLLYTHFHAKYYQKKQAGA